MTVPLPGGMADELLWHVANCPTCKAARIARNNMAFCKRGRQLIQLTLQERHGDDERGTTGSAEQSA